MNISLRGKCEGTILDFQINNAEVNIENNRVIKTDIIHGSKSIAPKKNSE